MKKSLYLFIGLLLGLGMTAYAATTVPLGKNGTSEYLLYPTDTLSAYTFIATSTTASSSFANGINLTNGCFAIGSVCLSTANIAESGNLYYTDSRVLTYLDTLSKGYFWSTTSADAWDATKDRWGTTSADYWYTLQSKASTTLLGDANTWSALQDFSTGLTASDVNTDSFTSHDYTNTFFEFTNTGASLNVPSTSNYLTLKNSTDAGSVNLRMENLTLARDIYFPDQSGTFALLSDITNASSTLLGDANTWSGNNSFSNATATASFFSSVLSATNAYFSTFIASGNATVTGQFSGGGDGFRLSSTGAITRLGGTSVNITSSSVQLSNTGGQVLIQNNNATANSGINLASGSGGGILNYYPRGISQLVGFVSDANRNFGIGTSSPGARLSITGAYGTTAPLFLLATSSTGLSTSTVIVVDQFGTSTNSNGIELLAGCFKVNGSCLTSGTGGGVSQWATSSLFSNMIHTAGAEGIGVGTTTPNGALTIASSSMVEMWFTHSGAVANNKLAFLSWGSGIFDIGTSSDAGATTSLLKIASGTTTINTPVLAVTNGSAVSRLIAGTGTSTPSGGIDIPSGCFAIGGVCVGGGSASTTFYADAGTFSAVNQFAGLTFTNATGTNATTSTFAATTICLTGDTCRTTWPTGGSGTWPFSFTTNFGVNVQSTSTPLWFTGTAGVYASGTSRFEGFTFSNATSTGSLVPCDLAGTKYASCFSGADIGAQINAAYAACPSTGCTIIVPLGNNTFSTKIAFETNAKPVRLECQQGTKMTWSGSGTSTVFNTGMDFQSKRGMYGCYLYGPDVGVGGTTVGVQLGGSNGEPGVTLDGNFIIGFGKGIVTTKNIWDINITNNRIQFNDRNIEVYSADNSGENFVFSGNNISDCSTVTKCVYFQTNGSVTSSWIGNVFDDAQLYFEDGNANINMTGGGFENPNEGAIGRYTYIVLSDGGYSNMTITGTQFSNGASTLANSPYQFITNGANLKVDNVTVQSFSSVESPAFVGIHGGGFWSGQVFEVGSAIVDISTTTSVGLVQLQNGRVGYGTTTPLDEFGIKGNVGIYSANGLNIYNADNTAYTTISRDNSKVHATWPWGFDDGATYGAGYTNILPPTGGLLAEGNTGIGTSSPYAKLSVTGTSTSYTNIFAVASSTGTQFFTVNYNGYVGIGSSTPWGIVSIIDPISDRQPGIVMATSSGATVFWGATASTSDQYGDPVRMLVGWGTKFLTNFDTFAQLSVNGEINTNNTFDIECNAEGMKKTAQNTADVTGSVISTTLGYPCGDFSLIEDANGVFDYVAGTTGNYVRLRSGATGATTAIGDGVGYALTTAGLYTATNTPLKLETSIRPVVNNATSTLYLVGFFNTTGVSANYAAMPTDGCGFVASTTQANWRIFCAKASSYTYVDSGIASTTNIANPSNGAFTRFRVEMGTTYATFRYLRGSAGDTNSWVTIGSISANYPNTAALNPTVAVGSVSAKLTDELQVRFIRAWYNDPEPY